MKTKLIQHGASFAVITWAKQYETGEVHYYFGVPQIPMVGEYSVDVPHDLIIKVENFCMKNGITFKP